MEYKLSNFTKKYFERYCREYLDIDPKMITEKAEVIYSKLMNEAPDMGGKGNMMASNMDITAAFFAYYEASEHRIDGNAMEVLINWLAEDYKWLGFFTDMNKRKYIKKLYYKIYSGHSKKVEQHKANGEWLGTWSIKINPDGREEGIYYHMSGCPLYAFAKSHNYEDMMPYICKFDFIFEKFLHAKLIRTQTEALGGEYCDYWFVPDKSKTAEKYKDFKSV